MLPAQCELIAPLVCPLVGVPLDRRVLLAGISFDVGVLLVDDTLAPRGPVHVTP